MFDLDRGNLRSRHLLAARIEVDKRLEGDGVWASNDSRQLPEFSTQGGSWRTPYPKRGALSTKPLLELPQTSHEFSSGMESRIRDFESGSIYIWWIFDMSKLPCQVSITFWEI